MYNRSSIFFDVDCRLGYNVVSIPLDRRRCITTKNRMNAASNAYHNSRRIVKELTCPYRCELEQDHYIPVKYRTL